MGITHLLLVLASTSATPSRLLVELRLCNLLQRLAEVRAELLGKVLVVGRLVVAELAQLSFGQLPWVQEIFEVLQRGHAGGLPVGLLRHVQPQRPFDLFRALLQPLRQRFRVVDTIGVLSIFNLFPSKPQKIEGG